MNILQGILWYAFKFVFIAAVAVGGVFAGKALRKHKDKKDAFK